MTVHLGIIQLAVGSFLKSKKSGDLVFRKDSGNVQKGLNVFFADERVVLGINEQVVIFQTRGKKVLVEKRQGPWILSFKVDNHNLNAWADLLALVGKYDDVHIERHGLVLSDKLRQVSIVPCSITCDGD